MHIWLNEPAWFATNKVLKKFSTGFLLIDDLFDVIDTGARINSSQYEPVIIWETARNWFTYKTEVRR